MREISAGHTNFMQKNTKNKKVKDCPTSVRLIFTPTPLLSIKLWGWRD
jgi:hypothetical protein